MVVCKSGQGIPYQAPGHYGQWGAKYTKADGSSRLTVSVTHFLPNGGAETAKIPERVELAYYVLSGSIIVKGGEEEHILNAGDLVHFTGGDERALKINGQVPASLLVMIVADKA